MRRATHLIWAVAGIAAAVVLVVSTDAVARPDVERCFLDAINSARIESGRQTLTTADDVAPFARAHAAHMATSGGLFHSARDSVAEALPPGWRSWGENVGWHSHPDLPDCRPTHRAFMDSAEHRANILDPDYSAVAIGVFVDEDGELWTTHIFFSHPDRQVARLPIACAVVEHDGLFTVAVTGGEDAVAFSISRAASHGHRYVPLAYVDGSTTLTGLTAGRNQVIEMEAVYPTGSRSLPLQCGRLHT